jgi:MFS family permease
VFTVGVFVFEVPSGYFADVLGRKLSLVLAAAFWIIGFSAYAMARSFVGFAMAELLLAFGMSLRSGTDAALVYDSLQETGAEGEFARYQGRVELASRVGTALASVAGGVLGAVLLELPVYLNIGTAVLMLVVAVSFVEPVRTRPPYESPLRGISRALGRCARDPDLLLPLLLGGVMMSVGIVGLWAYLLLLQKSGVSSVTTGVIFAVFQLASGLGAQRSLALERVLGARRLVLLFPLVGVGLVGLALWPTVPMCAVVMVANAFVWGVSGPLLMSRVNERTSSDLRATIISIGSMSGRLLYAVVAPIVGLLTDRGSVATGFAFLGAVTLAGTVVLGAIYFARLGVRAAPPGVEPAAGA